MKLSIIHTIEEGILYLDNQFSIGGNKIKVIEDPSPAAIVRMIDNTSDDLGGWANADNIYIWDRAIASHSQVSDGLGGVGVAVGFYIVRSGFARVDGNTVTTKVRFDVSDFSGNKNMRMLEQNPFFQGVHDAFAQRKTQIEHDAEERHAGRPPEKRPISLSA